MPITRATSLRQIKLACDPRPLEAADLAEFFVDTSKARDPSSNRRKELAWCLEPPGEFTKVLLAGHRGCGKSTELTKFCAENVDRFHTVIVSLAREAILSHLTIADLLVLVVERSLAGAGTLGDKLDPTTLKAVYDWFSETLEQADFERTATVEAGTKAGSEDSWIQKLLLMGAWIKTDIRAGSKVLQRTITRETRRLSELVSQCGMVLSELQLALRAVNRELLVLIEDLDKVAIIDAMRLFFDEPGPLADLPCKAIYTVPIFLHCSPRIRDLDPRFHLVTLPMIDIYDAEQCGSKAVRAIVERRMDASLIDGPALDLAVAKTGGVLRDLFDVLADAALVARQAVEARKRDDPRILEDDVRYGLNRRRSYILSGITVEGLPEEYKGISVDDLHRRLREYGDRPIRNATLDGITRALIQAHALIEYDGERWYRVHPLVLEHVEAQ